MSTTSTDPAAIEAGLERDRASLGATLDALSDRVSVDNIARQALGAFKSRAGDYTSTVDSAVRANPLAVALIGAGVAWLLLGRGRGGADRGTSFMGHPEHDELPRWESEGGPPPEYGSVAYRPTTSGPATSGSVTSGGDDHAWSREAQGLRGRAMAAIRRIEADAKTAYDGVRSGLSSGAGQARDFAAERASVVSTFASDLRARLSHGLDDLSEESRDRVLAARERAYAARLRAEQAGRTAVSDPGRMLEEHPLVAGAVAFALGAAAAAALPRTEAEDRAFGSESDRLMDEAAHLFRTERDRAMQVAGSLGSEIRAAAMDTVEAVADTATQKAQEAAARVSDRAAEEVGAARSSSGQSDPVIG